MAWHKNWHSWRKKGTWTWADLLYWFFYIPMTAIVVVALVMFPEKLFAVSLQPMSLDSSLMAERIYYSLADYDQFAGLRTSIAAPGKLDEILTLQPSEKRHAIKVQKGVEVWFPSKTQEEFYQDAAPLVPIRYQSHNYVFTYKDLTGQSVKVNVSQVFPLVYEKTRR